MSVEGPLDDPALFSLGRHSNFPLSRQSEHPMMSCSNSLDEMKRSAITEMTTANLKWRWIIWETLWMTAEGG
jgi:galactose mutarotase-like enzyme